MSTVAETSLNELIEAKVEAVLDQRLQSLVGEKLQGLRKKDSRPKRVAIAMVSRGTLDAAYPAFILATAAAAMGMECGIYFSFFGLNILKKKTQARLKLVPVGNPALPAASPQPYRRAARHDSPGDLPSEADDPEEEDRHGSRVAADCPRQWGMALALSDGYGHVRNQKGGSARRSPGTGRCGYVP